MVAEIILAGLVGGALGGLQGWRRGRAKGRAEILPEYREAYAALADGKLPPEPKIIVREVVKATRCSVCIYDHPATPVCRAGSCAQHCEELCGPSCPGRT